MAFEDLPMNQLATAARPVDAFIEPARRQIAAPAELKLMPDPSLIRQVDQGTGGNVQGVNQTEELAAALAPFSKGLSELIGIGAKYYAGTEYEKGQNEALRASVLANQQMLASGSEYAAENRRLDKVDPVAALMMDEVNPFRRGGRQNAFSRIAGQRIMPAVMKAYAAIPDVATLELGDPILKETVAKAVQGVLEPYGLDASSPGFIENVLPQISQAEATVYEQQQRDNVKYLKDTAWRSAALEIFAIYSNARATGVVEWTEFDPLTGKEVRRVAKLGENRADWERGVQVLAGLAAKRLADATGITGETTELQEKLFTRLSDMGSIAKNPELVRILKGTPIGQANKDGVRMTAGDAFGVELEVARIDMDQKVFQDRERSVQRGVEDFKSELVVVTQGMADGPARGAAIASLTEKYVQLGIPRSELTEAASSMSTTLDNLGARNYDPSQMDSLLQSFQSRVSADWDATAADQEFERLITTLAPQDRAEARRRYADIRRTKENEKNDIPSNLINPLISAKIKSGLRWAYPDNVTEASLRGADISAMMAWGDADVAKSAQLQLSAYTKQVVARLREAESRKGEKLTADEILRITTDALAEYGTKDKEAFQQLFPGSNQTDTPSVSGRARPPAPTSRPPSGTQPAPGGQRPMPAVFPSGQLDNIPNRSQRLRSGEPVLALPSLQEEIARIYNGQRPSAAVIRAARDAGFGSNVGKWLLREAGNYDSYDLDPQVRQKLLRSSNDAAGVAGATQVAAQPPSPVQQFGNWWMNVLTGTAPSYAGTRSSMEGGGRNGTTPFTGRPGDRSGGSFLNPAPGVSFAANRGGYDADTGLDIHGPEGTSVVASLPGTIVYAEKGHSAQMGQSSSSRGYKDQHSVLVKLDQPFTYNGKTIRYAWYSHLQDLDPGVAGRNGARISAGQRLGAMGIANGVPHLHFGLVGDREQTIFLTHREIRELYGSGGPAAARTTQAPTTRAGGGLTGIATYYSGSGGQDGVAGGRTANNEIYDPNKMTAAIQWSLRGKYLNKWVTVEDLDTGKQVRVWVNDVGPMGGTRLDINRRDPRVIDLSPAAFRSLFGGTQRGTGRIRIIGAAPR